MLIDWRDVSTPKARSALLSALVALLALGGALWLGVWLGGRNAEVSPKPPRVPLRPLTLGESRFMWGAPRLSPQSPLPIQLSELPPLEPFERPTAPKLPPTAPAFFGEPLEAPQPTEVELNAALKQTEAERAEAERAEAERAEAERAEAERAEAARAEAERAEAARAEAERAEAARAEAERAEAERAEAARAEAERAEAERAEAARGEAERAEAARAEAERAEAERAEAERAEAGEGSGEPKELKSTQRFNLQIKAFRHRAEAVEFVAQLSPQLARWRDLLYVLSAQSGGRPIYRVRLGPFDSKQEAKEAQRAYIKRFGSKDAPFISYR